MALTVKMLKGLGLTDEQREAVLEEHARTVDEIKVERDRLKKDAEKLITVQKELDDLKAAGDDGWEAKAKGWEKKYTDLVADNKRKETRAAKEAAVKAYYEGKGITGDNLTIAMMGSGEAIDKLCEAGLHYDHGGAGNPDAPQEQWRQADPGGDREDC